MDELGEMRKNLADFKKNAVRLLNATDYRLPPKLIETDLDTLLDDIKYLCGYLDCMIQFKIELPHGGM